MLRFLIVTATVLGLALSAVGSAQAADSKQVYDFYCAQCHGTDGKGRGINVTKDFATDPRNLTSSSEMEKRSDEDLRGVIKDGGPSISKSALMPPWGATLTTDEVEGLVKYIRKLCDCKGK
ncbi:MAG: cytochrome c [Gallionella sp.]|nr:cytochrome c [Gallionella sp.]